MKMINASVSLIKEQDPFKKIEIVGRTCYKSSSAMTEETARKFYKQLVNSKHTAMVEHAVFLFEVDDDTYEDCKNEKYLNATKHFYPERYLVSGNLRAINESKVQSLMTTLYEKDADLIYESFVYDPERWGNKSVLVSLDDYCDISAEELNTHDYYTVHFICDRGVTHEIVRHRPASFAQESTRYCNYSKDKFGEEITVIKPLWFDDSTVEVQSFFQFACCVSEQQYFNVLRNGWTPEQARSVLPNALKTELIMTAKLKEWKHFFDLRYFGTTGAPHPQAKEVAEMAYDLIMEV